MSFEYTQEGETVTAYLENNWGSRDITIKIKDSSGNAYTLKQRKTFYFKIHFTWGGWSEIKSMTIDVGNSGKTQTFPSAFIGYDDSQFIDSGTKELHFHDSDAVYLDFLRHISPYNGNTYDIGSEKYKWRNLYLDGYIMVGDKKFLLYADGSTARLRLVT